MRSWKLTGEQEEITTVTPAMFAAEESSPRRIFLAREITIAGRRIVPTQVFDTYWRFAAERQRVYDARQQGVLGPWTDDPILSQHRFTNCYRAADRVSQYLIRHVIYCGDPSAAEVTFRILLFKLFNKIETWELLESAFGELRCSEFDVGTYDKVLSGALDRGERLYSAAYLMPAPRLGAIRKHTNHLRLLQDMLEGSLARRLEKAPTMGAVFELLASYPGLGPFLAFQYATDLNYSEVLDFDEMDFVVAGPGARDGLRKCFGDAARGIEADLIRYVSENQEEHFDRLGIRFSGLRGRRLQLIDCQNLFCEVDKYARVAHPHVEGYSGRRRIKQKFAAVVTPVMPWFPPKWGINDHVQSDLPAPGMFPCSPAGAPAPKTEVDVRPALIPAF